MKPSTDFPSTFSAPTAAHRRSVRKIMRDFHVRAFGEELARINFLPEKRRKQAVAEMIDHARRKGVKLGRPALGVTP
ncbi:MAG: hypothetical protein ABI680_06975 [Chthoniobacteraceae bacterium]